jgi:hypothetical protein
MKRRAFLAALAAPLMAQAVSRLDGQRLKPLLNLVIPGDSLSNGSGFDPFGCQITNTCPQSWPNQLLAEIPDATYKGLAADMATITNEISAKGAEIDASFIPGRTNVLILWAGTNDIMLLGLSGKQTYEAYARFTAERLSRNPWTLLPFTLTPRRATSVAKSVDWFYEQASTFNSLMRSSGHPYLVDVAADPRLGAKYANFNLQYFFDGTHMTPEGQAIVKDLVMLQLLAI